MDRKVPIDPSSDDEVYPAHPRAIMVGVSRGSTQLLWKKAGYHPRSLPIPNRIYALDPLRTPLDCSATFPVPVAVRRTILAKRRADGGEAAAKRHADGDEDITQ